MLPLDYVVPVGSPTSSTEATVVGFVRVRLEDQLDLPGLGLRLRFVVLPPQVIPSGTCP